MDFEKFLIQKSQTRLKPGLNLFMKLVMGVFAGVYYGFYHVWINIIQVSLGYGEETYGTQIVDWLQFTTQDDDDTTFTGTNPLTRFHGG